VFRIQDVAKHAGTSVGSVSKVINGVEGVSDKMRDKVLKAIAELDYHPNVYARNMRAKSSKTIGVFVPLINDPYFPQFYNGIETKLEQLGYMPILFSGSSKTSSERPLDLLSQMMNRNLDGLIVSTYGWDNEFIEKLARIAEKMPVVSYKRKFTDSPLLSVGVNDYEGMYSAVSYLARIGHKHIAYINATAQLETSQDRLRGYKQALADNDIPFRESYITECASYSIREGYLNTRHVLRNSPLPTAIIGGNDTLAIGALKYLEELQIRVPQDIAVMGYDEIYLSQLVTPQLSTVALPVEQMTAKAVELIVSADPASESVQRDLTFGTELVVRRSTDLTSPFSLN